MVQAYMYCDLSRSFLHCSFVGARVWDIYRRCHAIRTPSLTLSMFEYKHLTPEERNHFVEHGWLKVNNAIDHAYMQAWLADFWVRLGWDKDDKSTWKKEYIKLPRHREVLGSVLCPEAWAKMCEVVGGEDKIDPIRERYFGDQWIVNCGSEARTKATGPIDHKKLSGWHTDNDW
jgi:hypothetical protein